jgi:hypothetical protein
MLRIYGMIFNSHFLLRPLRAVHTGAILRCDFAVRFCGAILQCDFAVRFRGAISQCDFAGGGVAVGFCGAILGCDLIFFRFKTHKTHSQQGCQMMHYQAHNLILFNFG